MSRTDFHPRSLGKGISFEEGGCEFTNITAHGRSYNICSSPKKETKLWNCFAWVSNKCQVPATPFIKASAVLAADILPVGMFPDGLSEFLEGSLIVIGCIHPDSIT